MKYEYDDGDEDEAVSENILKNQTATTPVLSSRLAQNWADKNIYTSDVLKNGISESNLISKLDTALKAGTIKQSDVDKILKGFGYSSGNQTTTSKKTSNSKIIDTKLALGTGSVSV